VISSASLPPNFRDVTAEKVGTVMAIVGATAAGKGTKPRMTDA
jgi:Tfp pilus assembly ATPase PilU